MATWNIKKLKDVTTKIGSGATPRGGKGAYHHEGTPLIRSLNIYDLNFIYDNLAFIDDSQAKQLANVIVEKDDVLLNITGASVCRCTSVPDNLIPARVNQHVSIIRADRKNLSGKYLKYALVSPLYKRALYGLATTGATREALTKSDIENFEIKLPDIEMQKHISSVLSAYDDLIENNQKRIKGLEGMAQLLYIEWFVKFKFPGHEATKMVDSGTEYGMIPEGWQIVPIGTMASFVNGYPFKPKDLGDSGLPIIKIPELRSGILEKTPRNDGENIPEKYRIKNGDIIFSWSATLLVNIWNSGHALLNQHLFLVSPKLDLYRSFVFYALTRLVEKLSKQAVGATMQHLRRDTVVDAKMILPTEYVLERYEKLAANLLQQIAILQKENQNLCKMRDLLVPQLVTGKRTLKA